MRRLDEEDLRRLMLGASVLGTGGGGSFSLARDLVADLARRGMAPALLDPAELEPGTLAVSTVLLGGGLSHEDLEAMGMISDAPASWTGAQALARFLGRPIGAVFPIEIGPQNTMEAVRLAAFLGVPVLDGDCAGRAVPEMHQTTLSRFEIPLTPYVVATFRGDVAVMAQVASDARSEALCRALAQASGGVVCVTGFPVEGARLREALIPGTLTRCMEMGALIGPGRRPAEALAARFGGRLAFRGRVARFEVDASGAFFRGGVDLEGLGPFEGSRYRVGFQNEYLWSWRDGELDAAAPDLVCVLDTDSGVGKVTYGHGFENALEPGQDLTVLHLPADAVWRGEHPFPPPPAPDTEIR